MAVDKNCKLAYLSKKKTIIYHRNNGMFVKTQKFYLILSLTVNLLIICANL